MTLRRYILVIVIIALAIFHTACGSNQPSGKPGGTAVYRPQWWSSQPSNDDYVYTYGQGLNVSESASINTAKANALQAAAQYVETEVNSMTKVYEQEAGVVDPQILALTQKVAKTISSAKFPGVLTGNIETRIVKEQSGTRYKTWVQLLIPKSVIRHNLMNNIRNEEALYNEFKESQAFQELDAELGDD